MEGKQRDGRAKRAEIVDRGSPPSGPHQTVCMRAGGRKGSLYGETRIGRRKGGHGSNIEVGRPRLISVVLVFPI